MDDAGDELPIMLRVRGRRCVVVGAGGVGVRRAQRLAEAGAKVVVVAPQVHPSARLVAAEVHERGFEPADLDGALLVVVATDRTDVNEAVGQAAAERGVLINRSDDASAGNAAFMSTHRDGPLTLAVHTGGASASAAGRIRDLLAQDLDPAWPRLLALALQARRAIQDKVADPVKRAAMLRRLSDSTALETLQNGGESALQKLYADIMQDSA